MPVKGAIIGFGHIAANGHVPAYRANPDFRIEAVCDSHAERMPLNERLLPGSRFYSSADELLEKEDIDFVDVSTPPAAHAVFILKALSSGRHVLCEKPLVLDVADLRDIWQTMERTGRVVVTVHNWRYSPILQKVSSLVRDGKIGRVKNMEYRVIRTQPSAAVGNGVSENWRLDPAVAGGGILVDHGWHAFYLVNEWADAVPEKVECRLENKKFRDIRVEDTAEVRFRYHGGMEARLFFTWAGGERSNYIAIEGSQGRIEVPDNIVRLENWRGKSEIAFSEGLSAGSHHPDWYGAVLREFLSEMKDRKAAGRNFKEASCCFNLLELCKRSSAYGNAVAVRGWENG